MFLATYTEGYKFLSENTQNDLMTCCDIVMSDNFTVGDFFPELEGYSVYNAYALDNCKDYIKTCLYEGGRLAITLYFDGHPFTNFAVVRFDPETGDLTDSPDEYVEVSENYDITMHLCSPGIFVLFALYPS